jgi:hypothetical protein
MQDGDLQEQKAVGLGTRYTCAAAQDLPVPLSTIILPANVDDTQAYCGLVGSIYDDMKYVVADMGYDDHKLYDFTRQRGARLICPIQIQVRRR